jgi:hypothetical protein
MIDNPSQIVWNKGSLPDVHSVPKKCFVLVWLGDEKFNLKRIEVVSPREDTLNPLRWCDDMLPIDLKEVKYWAWIEDGR